MTDTMEDDVPRGPSAVEEKLPEQIIENVLLEGINSAELLGNRNIVDIANTLSDVRHELSSILNEPIDEVEFQFGRLIHSDCTLFLSEHIPRMIVQDLLQKCSQNIKVKTKVPKKSQSQRPIPQKPPDDNNQNVQINLDDIYAHLKRQPWQYSDTQQYRIETVGDNVNDSNQLNEADHSTPKSTDGRGMGMMVMGDFDDDEVLSFNNHNNANHQPVGAYKSSSVYQGHHEEEKGMISLNSMNEELGQPVEVRKQSSDPADIPSPGKYTADMEPGGVYPSAEHKEVESEEENLQEEGCAELIQSDNVTLMGEAEQDNQVTFKLPGCHQDVFHQQMDNVENDIESAETKRESDHSDGDEEVIEAVKESLGKMLVQVANENGDSMDDDQDLDTLIVSDTITMMGFETQK